MASTHSPLRAHSVWQALPAPRVYWVLRSLPTGSATLSYLMTFAGFGVLLWMGDTPSLWMVYLFVIIYGPTFGSRGPIFNAMVARIFGAGPELGTIFGAVHLGMGMGAALGAVLGGLIHDMTGGYTAMLWTAMLCGVLALTLYWCTPEVRQA